MLNFGSIWAATQPNFSLSPHISSFIVMRQTVMSTWPRLAQHGHRLPVVTATEGVTQVTVRLLLVGVVLVVATVVLVVQLLSTLAGLTLSTLAVDVVGTLGLGEPVNFTASDAGEELLG